MQTDEDALRSYFRAYENGDVEGALQWMSDDIVYTDYAMGFQAHDKPYLRKAWNRYFEVCANPDHSSILNSLRVMSTGEYVIEWTERARLNADWQFLRATGKAYEVRGVSVGLLREGLIVRNSDYYDLTTILRQSGIEHVPPGIPMISAE